MKLAYYPGCSLDSSGVEYGLSTRRTAEILGIELEEIEDWNCCGATSGHNTNKLLSLALRARNLAIAEKTGLDVLAPCAACYNRFRTTEHAVRHDQELQQKIEAIIEMEYSARQETIAIPDLLANKIGPEKIKAKVVRPLQGMKAACYYGCLLVRPLEHTGFDDAEDPQSMDIVVQALGAKTVDWPYKTECCGAALATSRPDVGTKMIYEVLLNAKLAGAECIVTACPLCMMNLDMRQSAAEKAYKTKFNIPIYYITELLAIACGDAPKKVGTNRHFVEAVAYIENLRPEPAAETTAPQATSAEGDEAVQKKVEAFKTGFAKNPAKMASRLIEDPVRSGILAEIIVGDEKRIAKLAELMATDNEKAGKAAEAFVTGELKKREKQ
jgi:heterodisulfide reductase subunit B